MKGLKRITAFCLSCVFSSWVICNSAPLAQPALVGMGDSIGEGVQGADAAWQTQVFSYVNWVNFQINGDLTLPFIQTDLLGVVGDTSGRSRIYPDTIGTNIAVSGTTVASILYDQANAGTAGEIDTETDLVLFPRQQSQIEYVEEANPSMILCWIGNNDVLSSVISFGNMNTSQLTPVADFDSNFSMLTDRLGSLVANHGSKIVFANIPDVTDIAFLVDRATAESVTGFPVHLPGGCYTSIIGVLIMKILGNDLLIYNPDYVLDANEVAIIQDRIGVFNSIIAREADRIGMPVVDVNAKFKDYVANPPQFVGLTANNHFLGGLFSTDGVHPSNIGHALLANEFIKTMNQAFGMNIQPLNNDILTYLYLTDPSTDKDKDGKAVGRLGVGLLETLAFLFGITGDSNDFGF